MKKIKVDFDMNEVVFLGSVLTENLENQLKKIENGLPNLAIKYVFGASQEQNEIENFVFDLKKEIAKSLHLLEKISYPIDDELLAKAKFLSLEVDKVINSPLKRINQK